MCQQALAPQLMFFQPAENKVSRDGKRGLLLNRSTRFPPVQLPAQIQRR
jgi:hypothetical protein